MPLKRLACLLALALLLQSRSSVAETEAAAATNYYSNGSGLNVITPELRWKGDMDPRTQAALDFSVDAVSAASFDYGKQSRSHRLDPTRGPGTCSSCHVATDALSGASRSYKEERRGFGATVARRLGDERAVQVKASYHGNRENDYASDAYQAGAAMDFNNANTTVGLQASLLKDRVSSVITSSLSEPLDTVGADLSLTQVLTPLTVADFNYGFARAEGYQTNPYAYIQIGADTLHPVRAVQPTLKQRHVAGARVKQGLAPGLAAEVGYRYYGDDWGVQGHTAELSLSQNLGSSFVFEPHARWYVQPQGASFFQNFYDAPQAYMTRDLKLAPHQTSLLGVTLRGKLSQHFGSELNYSHYTRQDSLDYRLYFANGPENADLYQVVLTYE